MVAVLCVKCGCLIREEQPHEDKRQLYSTCWNCARRKQVENERRRRIQQSEREKWNVNSAREHRASWVFWTGQQPED